MGHTLTEKILLDHTDADDVRPGDIVLIRCDVVMANDVSGPVAFRQMAKMGAETSVVATRPCPAWVHLCHDKGGARPPYADAVPLAAKTKNR